jgi:mannose-6-phosphate isomerase-like protein (cupin superfamily)
MGYHVLDRDSLAPTPDHPCDRRSLSDAVDLATLAAAWYRLAPGEQLPRAYHYHEQREELFYVREGVLHVETPEREYAVPETAVFVAEPDSPHRAFNPADADGAVTVLGVGAPRFDSARPYDPSDAEGAGESDATQ